MPAIVMLYKRSMMSLTFELFTSIIDLHVATRKSAPDDRCYYSAV